MWHIDFAVVYLLQFSVQAHQFNYGEELPPLLFSEVRSRLQRPRAAVSWLRRRSSIPERAGLPRRGSARAKHNIPSTSEFRILE
jgi:hypothetical protein